jgi:hypothetical protein
VALLQTRRVVSDAAAPAIAHSRYLSQPFLQLGVFRFNGCSYALAQAISAAPAIALRYLSHVIANAAARAIAHSRYLSPPFLHLGVVSDPPHQDLRPSDTAARSTQLRAN